MINIDTEWDGDVLVLRCDTTKRYGKTRTEKNFKVASTEGSVPVIGPDGKPLPGWIFNLNLNYRKPLEEISEDEE